MIINPSKKGKKREKGEEMEGETKKRWKEENCQIIKISWALCKILPYFILFKFYSINFVDEKVSDPVLSYRAGKRQNPALNVT